MFMALLGGYRWLRSIAVGAAVGLSAFVLFEFWFGIPLPKGFVERALGF
jgi:putative tricarboxylic transport membrane protein